MRLCLRSALTLLLSANLVSATAHQQIGGEIRGNVRYSVRPQYSRLQLLFRGPVQHSEQLQGNVLTVIVTGIESTASDYGAKLQFKDGLIERVTVDRVVNGRSTVVLTLRQGVDRFTIAGEDGRKALHIDVHPGSATGKPHPLAATAIKRQPREKKGPQQATKPTSIVDIPAIARRQLEDGESSRQPGTNPQATTDARPMSTPTRLRGSFDSQSDLAWLLLACASLVITSIGIGALIYVAHRRKKAVRSSTIPGLAGAQASSSFFQRSGVGGSAARSEYESLNRRIREPREEDELSSIDADHAARSLAEHYHRNQGDIELAMKLHDHPHAHDGLRRIKTIKAAKLPMKGRLTTAKKLGVGKGELDLAVKLQRLQDAFREKEEIA